MITLTENYLVAFMVGLNIGFIFGLVIPYLAWCTALSPSTEEKKS